MFDTPMGSYKSDDESIEQNKSAKKKKSPSMFTPSSATKDNKTYSNLYKMSYSRIQNTNQTSRKKRQDYDFMQESQQPAREKHEEAKDEALRNSVDLRSIRIEQTEEKASSKGGRSSLISLPVEKMSAPQPREKLDQVTPVSQKTRSSKGSMLNPSSS